MRISLTSSFWFLTGALLVVRLLFIGTTMIIDDEAYYAMYARHLDWGYIDHGPVIGYLIRLFTIVFGENGFGIRFFGVVFITILGWLLYKFGAKYFSRTTGIVLSLTVTANMFTHTNAVVVTPDAPMAFFTILAMMSYYQAFFVDRKHFLGAGFLLGLAVLSKVSAVFPAIGIALVPLLVKQKRDFLREPRFYLSFVIAIVVALPFAIWNVQNDFAFIRYQGGHIARAGGWSPFLELWGGLFALAGPMVFYYSVVTPFRLVLQRWREKDTAVLFFGTITLVPLLYFMVQSFVSRMELNWPAPVFYGGIFLMGIFAGSAWEKRRRWFKFQIAYSLVLITVVTTQIYFPILPIGRKADITRRYHTYSAFKESLGRFLNDNPELAALRIAGNNFQLPSMVNVYEKPEREAICLSIGYHETLYAFLHPDETLVGEDFLFIGGESFPGHLRPYFETVVACGELESRRRGQIADRFTMWRLGNYKGKD